MKLITRFLCAIGRHEYDGGRKKYSGGSWDGGYWYEGRNTPQERWVRVKHCSLCKSGKIIDSFIYETITVAAKGRNHLDSEVTIPQPEMKNDNQDREKECSC